MTYFSVNNVVLSPYPIGFVNTYISSGSTSVMAKKLSPWTTEASSITPIPLDSNISSEVSNSSWGLLARGSEAGRAPGGGVFEGDLLIPLYVTIFILAVAGNTLVVVTLAQNKRMRTVTNVYLLNLAVSDLLLGVFCMPFTLVGQLLRNFIFGGLMCRLIPYFQAVSVSVGVWTLVAISLERYFAICRPLKSRRWQTQFHAYKMIAVVWLASLAWSSPVLLASRLQAMREPGRNKCREVWPSLASERTYNLFLDAMLLLVPLVIMSLAYGFIVSKLWKGLRREIQHNSSCRRQTERSPVNNSISNNNSTPISTPRLAGRPLDKQQVGGARLWLMVRLPAAGSDSSLCKSPTRGTMNGAEASRLLGACSKDQPESRCEIGHELTVPSAAAATYTFNRQAIRSNYMDKSIDAKKKVIRMLFVVVAEFFVCWAPLHVLNTWYVFNPDAVYAHVGRTGVALVQLLAYISSCCNPITYCFMNRKFRAAFLGIFGCRSGDNGCCASTPRRSHTCTLQRPALATNNNSDVSGNDSTQCAGRASVAARSEVLVLDAEDRV